MKYLLLLALVGAIGCSRNPAPVAPESPPEVSGEDQEHTKAQHAALQVRLANLKADLLETTTAAEYDEVMTTILNVQTALEATSRILGRDVPEFEEFPGFTPPEPEVAEVPIEAEVLNNAGRELLRQQEAQAAADQQRRQLAEIRRQEALALQRQAERRRQRLEEAQALLEMCDEAAQDWSSGKLFNTENAERVSDTLEIWKGSE